MAMAREDHFGAEVAEDYDETSAEMNEPALVGATVDFLARLAGDGAALEFAVGTGRIALPLVRRGLRVEGIDLSPAMVAQLRTKEGGGEIPVTIGDITTTRVDGEFSLVYLVFNTIMNLTTQREQVACFQNAARHLAPGGRFVVEVMVPDLRRLAPGDTLRPFRVEPQRWGFDEYDVATQGLVSHHLWIVEGTPRSRSVPFRYVWPSELDLMAQLAGMEIEERWGGWRGEPFTSESTSHVSVWRLRPAGNGR